jgi:hypothetical protein
MTDSLTQEAVVQRTPVYERLRQTKMTLAKHLVLGLVVGRQVGKGKGLVDKEKWSGEESLSGSETPPGSSCARKVFLLSITPLAVHSMLSGTNIAQHPANMFFSSQVGRGVQEGRLSRILM